MKSKKLFFASAMALTLGLAPVYAFNQTETIIAAEPETITATATITINDAVENDVYKFYQIFKGSHTGTLNEPNLARLQWGDAATDTVKQKMIEEINKNLSNDKKLSIDASAEDVAANLNQGNIKAVADVISDVLGDPTYTATGTKDETSSKVTATAEVITGYYLITSPSKDNEPEPGIIMKVVGDATVTPKTSSTPQYEKKVKENVKENDNGGKPNLVPDETKNDVADYTIGDEIEFELAAKVPTGIENYDEYEFIFHDKMSEGLSLVPGTIEVWAGNEKLSASDYKVTTDVIHEAVTDTFDVSIMVKTGGVVKYNEGTVFSVKFKGKLNENAVIGKDGNTNGFILEYTNNPNTGEKKKSPEDKVIVFTYDLDLNKVDNKNTDRKLTGAKFKLSREVNGKREYLIATSTEAAVKDANGQDLKDSEGNVIKQKVYRVTGWGTEAEATELDSPSSYYQIEGLDDGTYYLKETKAPDGYNLPANEFVLIIDADTHHIQNWDGQTNNSAIGDISLMVDNKKVTGTAANIENTQGNKLPETGGMGTTTLYITGAILAGGAAVLYVTNKRMKKEI